MLERGPRRLCCWHGAAWHGSPEDQRAEAGRQTVPRLQGFSLQFLRREWRHRALPLDTRIGKRMRNRGERQEVHSRHGTRVALLPHGQQPGEPGNNAAGTSFRKGKQFPPRLSILSQPTEAAAVEATQQECGQATQATNGGDKASGRWQCMWWDTIIGPTGSAEQRRCVFCYI